MIDAAEDLHRYSVCSRDLDRHLALVVQESSFEAAAVAYLEQFGDLAPNHEMSVVVRNLASGSEHCFRIDLDTGETSPCA